jgi:hypothetical protein
MILGKMPNDTTAAQIEEAIKTSTFKFKSVQEINKDDYEKFGIEQNINKASRKSRFTQKQKEEEATKPQFLVNFDSREDMVTLAHHILFEKTIQANNKSLFMMHHTKKGNYNPETSICLQFLNYACTEQDLIEEINLLLRDDRIKKEREVIQRNAEDGNKIRHMVLSCIVFVDKVTQRSK